jgi:flagellar motor component MotA
MGELIAGGLLILFCVALSYLMSGIENTVIEVAVSLFLVVMGGILIYLLISFTLDYLEIHTEERKKKKEESGR